MEEEFFSCSLSRQQRIVTAIVVVVTAVALILPAAGAFLTVMDMAPAERVVGLPVAGLIVALAVLMILLPGYAPRGYAIGDEGIAVVRRNGRRILLPKSQVLSVAKAEPGDFKRCIRGCGVGGYFGSWGYFWSPALKGFRAYITDTKTAVLVRTRSQGLFVLSPDDRDDFIAHAKDALGLG